MSRTQNDMNILSNILSDVMRDLGVNDKMVKARRKASMLCATLKTLYMGPMLQARNYEFGSQSEGSTTPGLNSDIDRMVCLLELNVIQNKCEHNSGSNSLLVIQNEAISPSYCHLQLLRSDEFSNQLFIWGGKVDVLKHCVIDSKGRLLLKNILLTYGMQPGKMVFEGTHINMHGPALTQSSAHNKDVDVVYCFYSESLPQQVKLWIQQRKGCDWPTEDVFKECRKAGCFLVPADSKLSSTPELEWRISTHLQERYLMLSLNITQLGCYVLMKIILKTYINPQMEDVLSSYMCKNVVFYCVSESPHDWHTGSLLFKLKSCLIRLQKCVEHVNCPHFIIPENNLMAGRISEIQQKILLEIIGNLVENMQKTIFNITIDMIGIRMLIKINKEDISDLIDIEKLVLHEKLIYFNRSTAWYQKHCLDSFFRLNVPISTEELIQRLHDLHSINQCRKSDIVQMFPHTDIGTLRTACRLVKPLFRSTVGSLLAGRDIASDVPLSDEAFRHLTEGKDSDVLSGRLKLVSVLYCTGDMKRTEEELESTLKHYRYNQQATHFCGCYFFQPVREKSPRITDFNEKTITSNVALCVTFLHKEINCVPHELRYEIWRSYNKEDKQKWTFDHYWMNYIVVDSIPFLYYLQYKIYNLLDRRGDQLKALQSLADVIVIIPNFGHRETALNLLGQCCEMENMQAIALKCYISSLKHRRRNNAARLLLCLQLFKLKKQTQHTGGILALMLKMMVLTVTACLVMFQFNDRMHYWW